MHSKSDSPKVFISYKWQDEEHNVWVERLYKDLRAKYGVDAQLDRYEVDFGESFGDYMTSRIDRECDAMLFVITPAAVQAVDKSLSGGVHFEMQLANARRSREQDFRIIGIYREGNENTAYLRDHRYADFRDDSLYEQNLKELADSLWRRRSKPKLGGQGSEVSLDMTREDLTGVVENAPPFGRGTSLAGGIAMYSKIPVDMHDQMIFLSYAHEDIEIAKRLYRDLSAEGLTLWFDQESLLPGQKWKVEIKNAIENSDYFIALLSPHSISKRGYVQKELHDALEILEQCPESDIFIIPVRVKECRPSHHKLHELQWVDLFPFYSNGLRRILQVVRPQAQTFDNIDSKASQTWEDLTSNDSTRIEAAVGQIGDQQKGGYAKRLLAIISDQRTNDLQTCIAAGNAIEMLGDPRLDTLEMEMIQIPEGTFTMGTEGDGDESPRHDVYLNAFEIAKYPLTNIQYKAFLNANPDHREPKGWNKRTSPAGKANHPVVNISWKDAQAYAEWLSKQRGKHYRLPTEAEWEKAARGTDGRTYPWGNEFDPRKCNTIEGGPGDTTPVGIYPEGASLYGVADMAGNIWEWCEDRYSSKYYEKSENRNPNGPNKGDKRVVRGGACRASQGDARCVVRRSLSPYERSSYLGVRFSTPP